MMKRSAKHLKTPPIIRNRQKKGFYQSVFIPFKTSNSEQFFKYTRMTSTSFDLLVELLKPQLAKKKSSVSIEEKVAATLYYLSQGLSMQMTADIYQLGHATVHQIIKDTCETIWEVLAPEYLIPPNPDAWKLIAEGFYRKLNFPNCLGALGGKYINVQPPANVPQVTKDKKNISILLLACADAEHQFRLINMGENGSQSDKDIFQDSIFGRAGDATDLEIPPAEYLPGTNTPMYYTFAAGKSFPLKDHIMRPFPTRELEHEEQNFNYRLLQAHQVIENAFGVLSARWQILKTTIRGKLENIYNIVKAIICLHNFAIKEHAFMYNPPGYADLGLWRKEVGGLESVGQLATTLTTNNEELQRILCDYFASPEGIIFLADSEIVPEDDNDGGFDF